MTHGGAPRLLVVQHERSTGPGWFRPWLEQAGLRLDVVHPYADGALPGLDEAVPGYAGLVVLGGAMGPLDDERCPWLPDTRALLARAVETGLPTFGICLGAELMAAACGGQVRRGAAPELGVLEVHLDEAAAGDPLFAGLADTVRVVQWHWEEIVRLPPGAVRLARSRAYENQAFRLGPAAWGVQGHPEVTGDIAQSWAREDSPLLVAAGRVPDDLVGEVRSAEDELVRTWRKVADAFAGVVREVRTTGGASGAGAAR